MGFGPNTDMDVAEKGEALTGFSLRISLENDALQHGESKEELARILRDAANKLMQMPDETYKGLRDISGNTVGYYQFTTDDEPLGRWPGGGPISPEDL